MTELEIIKKWNLNQRFIAEQIGLSKATFTQKLLEKEKYHYFKQKDLDSIKSVLKDMAKDIEGLK